MYETWIIMQIEQRGPKRPKKKEKKMQDRNAGLRIMYVGKCNIRSSQSGPNEDRLLLVLQRRLLQLLGGVSSGILLLGQLRLGCGQTVGLGGLLRSISAAAVGLGGSGLLLLEAGNLLLGLLNVLCIDVLVGNDHV